MRTGRLMRMALRCPVLLGVLALGLAFPGPSVAAVEGRACAAEPTDTLIEHGDLLNCAFEQIGDSDVFRFDGGSGETIRVQTSDLGGANACFQVYDPDGIPLDALRCFNAARDYLLAQTGTHSVIVTELGNNAVGRYALALERIDPSSPAALPLEYNDVINDEINQTGDVDLFFFNGEAGDTVRVQTSDLSGGNACFQLYSADGAPLDTPRCFNAAREYPLVQTGQHAIVVTELGNNAVARYALSLACVSGACPELDLAAISGCVVRLGTPLSQRRVRLIQADEPVRTTRTDVRGCYAFNRVVADKPFQVRIAGPRLPQ